MRYRICSYNVENQRMLFHNNGFHSEHTKRNEALTKTISKIQPYILGVVEGSDLDEHHNLFLGQKQLKGFKYKVAKSQKSRGAQDLVFYYRAPFEVLSIDQHLSFYDDWREDIDGDTIDEFLTFNRKPLEVRFKNIETGDELLAILVSFKSKGVFSTSDMHRYQDVALANRKKLYAQSKKVRERLVQLFEEEPNLPVIVMGDLNDEPGMDYFQKIVGASAIETIMGDLFHPEQIYHNALWDLVEKQGIDTTWTIDFYDPIVRNRSKHRAWVDHIFVSPNMLKADNTIRFVKNSGSIAKRDQFSKIASDHLPVFCEIEME